MSETKEESKTTSSVSCSLSLGNSPSLSCSPHIEMEQEMLSRPKTPETTENPRTPIRFSNLSPRIFTPLTSPVRMALRLTKLGSHDAWLPLTESRKGNMYYAAFHILCSGIGIQALVLPLAFTYLGWIWGIISLSVAFIWQLYTLWILVQLHESTETGMRYSRYLDLICSAFGKWWGNSLGLFPIIYLSAGTCVLLVIIGGSSLKALFHNSCGSSCSAKLTIIEWYLVFASAAVLLSYLPNLNSIAGVSSIGAISVIGYCTLIWVVSVAKGRLPGVSYQPLRLGTRTDQVFQVINALGVVAFAFRGHNLILEIQGTMPSNEKNPSHEPMWKGVIVSYTLVAICLYPLAIGGYWAYGHQIPPYQGMLGALNKFHSHDVPHFILSLASFFVVTNSVGSFQIYGMPSFDLLESIYTRRMKKPCPWWLRSALRTLFGYFCFFAASAAPYLGGVAGLVGGVALPITLAYPCLMWIKLRRPKMYTAMWWLNWGLGISGMCLSALLVAAGVYVIVKTGLQLKFFHPQNW